MISVIMPVYNVEKYVGTSIKSILNQSYKDIELIIIDDASADKTLVEVKKFENDSRVKIISLDQNGGAAKARNIGIEEAKGEFIAFQDGDDYSVPNRLKILKEGFLSNDIGFVHSDMVLMNEQDSSYGYINFTNLPKENVTRFFLKIGAPYSGATLMIRKEALGDLRYDENLRIGEDTDLVYTLSQKTNGYHIPEALYVYRRHNLNTTRNFTIEEFVKHINKFLRLHELKELIPETDKHMEALAIIALFMWKRGQAEISQLYLTKATGLIKGTQDELFVTAIGSIIMRDYNTAITCLKAIEKKDHIIHNYLGEAYAYLGELKMAWNHFINSMEINPEYLEPRENIKALGALQTNMVDVNWTKFLKEWRMSEQK